VMKANARNTVDAVLTVEACCLVSQNPYFKCQLNT
jgi:hypothetical protein